MSEAEQTPIEQEKASERQTEHVAPHDILFITRAYNMKEISFEEWLRRSREWAEKIIGQHQGEV